MASCTYYLCRLAFFFAQAVSWYIILTYLVAILPYAEPILLDKNGNTWVQTHREKLNLGIVLVNLCLHLVFISLHHYSHWKVFLSDPGYIKSFIVSTRIGTVPVSLPTSDDEKNNGEECVDGGEKEASEEEKDPGCVCTPSQKKEKSKSNFRPFLTRYDVALRDQAEKGDRYH